MGHELAYSAPFTFAGAPITWEGRITYPAGEDPFGNDVIEGHYRHFGADIMITLCDVFMMNPEPLRGMSVAHWTPVDCAPMGRQDADRLRLSGARIISMSRFGHDRLREAGFHPLHVPHGVDTEVFRPPEDRDALRASMGIEKDAFVIGMNAMNKDGARKAFTEQLQAFAAFRRRHPHSLMMMHTLAEPKAGGLNLMPLLDSLGLRGSVVFPNQYSYLCGMMDASQLAAWYGAMDLLTSASYGEGFGIPVIEAQACGTPAVVSRASTGPELAGPGWLADGEPSWIGGMHDSWWFRPSVTSITAAYEDAWETRETGKMTSIRERSRKHAMQYDAGAVAERYWRPVLRKLEETLPRTRRMTVTDRAGRDVPERPDTAAGDLCVLTPSRGRPASVRRLIEAVQSTAVMKTHVWLGFDKDDPCLDENIAACKGYEDRGVRWIAAERRSLAGWTNELAQMAMGLFPALASFGDDHVPETKGWDAALLSVLDGGISYPDDKVRDDIPEAVVMSSGIVQALGWMCLPELHHYFVDNVWAELGRRAQCITYCPDVIVEHVHYLKDPGKVERDATYQANELRFASDQRAFEEWRQERMHDDVRKVRDAVAATAAAAVAR